MEAVMEDDDLLEEILVRLPAEIVHGCKPVSKLWCNLISSLRFRRRHGTFHLHLPTTTSNNKIFAINHKDGSATTLLNISNGVTVIKTSTSKVDPTKLLFSIQPFYQKIQKHAKEYEKVEFRVHDTYNGLFLFSLRRKPKEFEEFDYSEIYDQRKLNYVVCNPLTKEYHEIPITHKQKVAPLPELAFAPSKPYYGHYKVILVSLKQPRGDVPNYMVKIYSSETNTWIDLGHLCNSSLYESMSIVWDNCLLVEIQGKWEGEWVCVLDSARLRVLDSSSLLPSIVTIKKPKTWYSTVYIGESGGVLYAIVEEEKEGSSREKLYMLWEMKGVDGAWRENFRFKTEEDAIIVYIHRECEHILLLFWLKSTATFYYCWDGNTESLQEAGNVLDIYHEWNIRSYTPNLLPLGGVYGADDTCFWYISSLDSVAGSNDYNVPTKSRLGHLNVLAST